MLQSSKDKKDMSSPVFHVDVSSNLHRKGMKIGIRQQGPCKISLNAMYIFTSLGYIYPWFYFFPFSSLIFNPASVIYLLDCMLLFIYLFTAMKKTGMSNVDAWQ